MSDKYCFESIKTSAKQKCSDFIDKEFHQESITEEKLKSLTTKLTKMISVHAKNFKVIVTCFLSQNKPVKIDQEISVFYDKDLDGVIQMEKFLRTQTLLLTIYLITF